MSFSLTVRNYVLFLKNSKAKMGVCHSYLCSDLVIQADTRKLEFKAEPCHLLSGLS